MPYMHHVYLLGTWITFGMTSTLMAADSYTRYGGGKSCAYPTGQWLLVYAIVLPIAMLLSFFLNQGRKKVLK